MTTNDKFGSGAMVSSAERLPFAEVYKEGRHEGGQEIWRHDVQRVLT